MGRKNIFPSMIGAAVGAAAVYAVRKAIKRDKAARIPVSQLPASLRPAAWAYRANPLTESPTPDRLARMGRASAAKPMPDMPGVVHRVATVQGRGGAIPVHILEPLHSFGGLPVVEWMHDGAFAGGNPRQSAALVCQLMDAAPSVFVLPEYRLSGQAEGPAAAQDCYDCLIWIRDNIDRLGGRPDQIFVGGQGAGGNLACALTLMARDWGKVNIAFQMPLYPMLDDRMLTASSRNNDAPLWDARANRSAWRLYAGPEMGTPTIPKYVAPARETDYAGLPPAYSFIGDLDPLVDETVAYFSQLRQAGVPAELDIYPRCYHGFESVVPDAPVSQEALGFLATAFRNAVETRFA